MASGWRGSRTPCPRRAQPLSRRPSVHTDFTIQTSGRRRTRTPERAALPPVFETGPAPPAGSPSELSGGPTKDETAAKAQPADPRRIGRLIRSCGRRRYAAQADRRRSTGSLEEELELLEKNGIMAQEYRPPARIWQAILAEFLRLATTTYSTSSGGSKPALLPLRQRIPLHPVEQPQQLVLGDEVLGRDCVEEEQARGLL